METEGLDKLLAIANGPEVESHNLSVDNMSDEITLKQFDRAMLSTIDMPSDSRYGYINEFVDENLNLSAYSRDEVFKGIHAIHPKGVQASIDEHINKAVSITDHHNDSDTISSIQNNYWKFAPEAMPLLEKRYSAAIRKDSARELERSVAGMTLEVDGILNEDVKNYGGLSPQKSIDAHARDWYKLWENNLPVLVSEGSFGFHGPDGIAPGYTVPDSDNIQSNLVGNVYIIPKIKQAIEAPVQAAREDFRRAEEDALSGLHKNLFKLPEDLRANVILDYALNQKTPADSIRHSIERVVKRGIEDGRISTYREIAMAWKAQHDAIEASIAGRMQGYAN